MTHNLFDNAKFGDMFLTTENKQAVFLRFAENAEYEFAILYVEGWGNVQVFRHNGKEIYNDAAHSIISKKEEPVNKDLEESAEVYAYTNWQSDDYHEGAAEGLPFDAIGHTEKCFKDGAKWKNEKFIDKACDWLKQNWSKYVWLDGDNTIHFGHWTEDFRKYMEEQL